MDRGDATDDAIDRLVLSGLIDSEEAARLRGRHAQQAETPRTEERPRPERWTGRRDPEPAPIRWSVPSAPQPPPPSGWGAPSGVDAPPDPVHEAYEPFAAALLRVWGSVRAARRAVRTPRVLARLGLVVLTILVVLFWVLLAFALLSPLPAPVRPVLLLGVAGLLVFVCHRRGTVEGDAWSVGGLLAASALGVAAVHTTPWSIPYPLLMVPLFAALMFYVGTRRPSGLAASLPAVPVAAVPWVAVLVAERSDVPLVPVFVALSLLLLAVGALAALPVLHRPQRRRFAWRPGPMEPVAIVAGAMLLWVLPATLDRLETAGILPVLSVVFVLITLFLYGLRVRSLAAITFALVAPVVLVVFTVLTVLGPFGWLLSGVGLGALGVWVVLRRRLAAGTAARPDGEVDLEVELPGTPRRGGEPGGRDPRSSRSS